MSELWIKIESAVFSSGAAIITKLSDHPSIRDCLYLAIIFVLSSLNYVFRIGFYSDDWALLETMSSTHDQSVFGVFSALTDTHDHEIRPIQFFHLALLYKLFGLAPLGYHLTNAIFLCLGSMIIYLIARAIQQPRVLALSVSLVFMLAPNYSTDRFWIASSASNISMCFFGLALLAHWRALQRPRPAFVWWEALAVLAVLGSGFCYEVFLPLFLLITAILFIFQVVAKARPRVDGRIVAEAILRQAPIVVAVAVVVVIKALWAPRVPRDFDLIAQVLWAGHAVLKASLINYGYHLVLVPFTFWHVARHYADFATVVTAAVIGFAIWVRLYSLAGPLIASRASSPAMMPLYLGCGLALFVAGYSLFPINPAENGPNNRAAIAGTLGFAVSVIGIFGMLTTFAPRVWRKALFCTAVALIGMGGTAIIGTVASFWVTSYQLQTEILSDIRGQIQAMPSGAMLVLDGICPYYGIAPIFESAWDLSGALRILYGEPSIQANVAGRGVAVKEHGLVIAPSGDSTSYRYGRLYVYHFGRRKIYALTDAETAQSYFDAVSPERGDECPADAYGNGVDVMNGLVSTLKTRFRGAIGAK